MAFVVGQVDGVAVGEFLVAGDFALHLDETAPQGFILERVGDGDGLGLGQVVGVGLLQDGDVVGDHVGHDLRGSSIGADGSFHPHFVANVHADGALAAEDLHLDASGVILHVEFDVAAARVEAAGVHGGHAFDGELRALQGAGRGDGDDAPFDAGDYRGARRGMGPVTRLDLIALQTGVEVGVGRGHGDIDADRFPGVQRIHPPDQSPIRFLHALGQVADLQGFGKLEGRFQVMDGLARGVGQGENVDEIAARLHTLGRFRLDDQALFDGGRGVGGGVAGRRVGESEVGGVVVRVLAVAGVAARKALQGLAVAQFGGGRAFGEAGGRFFAPTQRVDAVPLAVLQFQAPFGQVDGLLEGPVGGRPHVLALPHQQKTPVRRNQRALRPAGDARGVLLVGEPIPQGEPLQVDGRVGGVVEFDEFLVVVALDAAQHLADEEMVGRGRWRGRRRSRGCGHGRGLGGRG